MNRKCKEFKIDDAWDFKLKAWNWSQQFKYSCILENKGIKYPNDPFINMLAVGAKEILKPTGNDSFECLKNFYREHQDWMLGYLSYDLKNQIEALNSNNPDYQQTEEILFFVPEILLFFKDSSVIIYSFSDPDVYFEEINRFTSFALSDNKARVSFLSTIDKNKYLETIGKIKEHLLEGDIYEINYCIEFAGKSFEISPLNSFYRLINNSPMPFSFYLRSGDQYIICSSPERFLKMKGERLVSQPIKGTIKRGETDAEDEALINHLKSSEKEIAENMMIVDIVRNDLAKSSVPGSITVEEMFEIYSFKQLHQMISTISSQKRPEVHFIDTIKNAFPMGSMTGAPKIRAMEIIEQYETSKRGAFSGAGGYFTPEGDFDLNVIIRSIFYNSNTGKLSFQVGSAITFDADPEYEYQECLLKAKAIFEILDSNFQEFKN
ncbi:MAG TPA: anthranilate synthase component I family protein [Cytophagales bacterium]|nr:anthranilate synthase component I family protein [Cytophagales bacterium]